MKKPKQLEGDAEQHHCPQCDKPIVKYQIDGDEFDIDEDNGWW